MRDEHGDRMKEYERIETDQKFIPGLPIYVRLDGRSFSKFTKGMERPFDERMAYCMTETTIELVKQSGARLGYTQSDEISLLLYNDDPKSQMWFGGKKQKLVSTLAAIATARFNQCVNEYTWSQRELLPTFDCRAMNVPNVAEAINQFVWREKDATKNSVSMAAQHYYSHKELQNKSHSEKLQMLEAKGIVWGDYPVGFKRGTYVHRETEDIPVDEVKSVLAREHMKRNGITTATRSFVVPFHVPPIAQVLNKEGVLLHDIPAVGTQAHKEKIYNELHGAGAYERDHRETDSTS